MGVVSRYSMLIMRAQTVNLMVSTGLALPLTFGKQSFREFLAVEGQELDNYLSNRPYIADS